jgi:hypothetical protein
MLVSICLMLFLGGCKLETDDTFMVVSGISPSRLLAKFPATLEITGTGFKDDSKVVFNNIELETEYVDEGTLTCRVTAQNTVIPVGAADTGVPVYVKTPSEEERSEVIDVTISHQPEFNTPTLIYDGAAEGFFNGSLRLVVNEKPRLYAVWMEGEAWFGNLHPRKMSISEDNGETWSEAKEIPAVDHFFVQEGVLHALDSADRTVAFHTSSDMGDTWTSSTIAVIEENDTFNGYVSTVSDSGTLFLVYGITHSDSTTMILYTKKSEDLGSTWESVGESGFVNIDSDYQLEWLLVNNAGAIQVGYSYEIDNASINGSFLSNDGGVGYQDTEAGFRGYVNGFLEDNGQIYVAYNAMSEPNLYSLHFFKGLNYGSAVTKNIELFSQSATGDMKKDAYGNILIAFNNYLIRSIDDGETWTDPASFSTFSNTSNSFVNVDEDDTMHIVWIENNEIYFTTVK